MNKKQPSMVRRVVLIPMSAMLLILVISVIVFAYTIFNMQQQLLNYYESTARVALSRIDMRLKQIDNEFVNYWVNDVDHSHLKSMLPDTPREEYLRYQAGN